MPGTAWRSRAMSSVTLCAGSWPPSPGLAPCTILISSSSARARYSAVTPNRAEATCLIRLSARSPLSKPSVAVRILAAFARVGARADPVHRDREGGVRLGRQRAERHGGGHEPAADRLGRLDLVERDRRPRSEAEQVAAARPAAVRRSSPRNPP